MKNIWALPILSLALTSTSMIVSNSAQSATLFRSTITGDQEVITNPDGTFTSIDTGSSAIGFAELELNEAEDALSYTIDVSGLDFSLISTLDPSTSLDGAAPDIVSQIHIHNAPFGANGPIVFSIASLVGTGFDDEDDLSIDIDSATGDATITGVWETTDTRPLTPELVSELEAGNFYFNIHTVGFPPGEIRGQIETVPEPTAILGLAFIGGVGFLSRKRR